MDPLSYNEVRTRLSLEERLESIISGAALMADSSCTRDERRERIVTECNAVRQALQDLLTEYMANVSNNLCFTYFCDIRNCKFNDSSVIFTITFTVNLFVYFTASSSTKRRKKGTSFRLLAESNCSAFWVFFLLLLCSLATRCVCVRASRHMF